MAERVKVHGYEGLIRDIRSNAIINTNKSEYTIYMDRIKTRAKQATQVDSVSFRFHDFIAIRELITYNSTHTFNDHAAKLIE